MSKYPAGVYRVRQILAEQFLIEKTPAEVFKNLRANRCKNCGHTWRSIRDDGEPNPVGQVLQCPRCDQRTGEVIGE